MAYAHESYLAAKKARHPELAVEWTDYAFTINLANTETRRIANIYLVELREAGERHLRAR